MSGISRNRRFQKMSVSILRPVLSYDVTLLRDVILTDYTLIKADVRTFIEPMHSEINRDRQMGGIPVERMGAYFDKGEDIKPNDVLREDANVYNENTVTYWQVTGIWNYTRYGFHIRVDLDKMNFQRT